MAAIDGLLLLMKEKGASDLHFAAGQPAKLRLHGSLQNVDGRRLDDAAVRALTEEICSPIQLERYRAAGDLDFAYALPGVARFRANLFVQERGAGAVFRIIPEKIRSVEELRLSPAIANLANLPSGLVVVTGPTGSGKSTTLAALVDSINTTRACHIVTIEDPIEFVHPRKRSVVSHREVGAHTPNFAQALKAALREDPDVILVGEMRDLETVALALTCAEMGVLVFGTLHTNSAAKTIDRIIDVFPVDQQGQARAMLAESLAGVVAQLLLRTSDGLGRVAAHEVLLRTSALGNVIREANTALLASVMQAGRKEGMVLMDDALWALVQSGQVNAAEAYAKALEKKRFEHLLGDAPVKSE
jgi:twitching motility protein PilT